MWHLKGFFSPPMSLLNVRQLPGLKWVYYFNGNTVGGEKLLKPPQHFPYWEGLTCGVMTRPLLKEL